MNASVQDEAGESRPIVMGSYGIGVERSMAAIVEASHDEKGIVWPISVAPYEVVITTLRADDPAVMEVGNRLHDELATSGVDVLYDDRVERPGVKFADSELVGIPLRVTLGPKGITNGTAEISDRKTGETRETPLETLDRTVVDLVREMRAAVR
jgi:prolyl-tRNA synthetase